MPGNGLLHHKHEHCSILTRCPHTSGLYQIKLSDWLFSDVAVSHLPKFGRIKHNNRSIEEPIAYFTSVLSWVNISMFIYD